MSNQIMNDTASALDIFDFNKAQTAVGHAASGVWFSPVCTRLIDLMNGQLSKTIKVHVSLAISA